MSSHQLILHYTNNFFLIKLYNLHSKKQPMPCFLRAPYVDVSIIIVNDYHFFFFESSVLKKLDIKQKKYIYTEEP